MEAEPPEFLVVTARANPNHWVLPKGHLEAGETPEDTAIRELREEAGVEGELTGRIGSTNHSHGGEDIDVTYFLIRAVAEGTADEQRERRWLPYDEARALLSFDNTRAMLDKAARALGIG